MPLSLNNSKDIVANSISVLKGNRTIDVLETIDAVTGLAPDTLNSLEKLATAMNNDPAFFTELSDAIRDKQNTLSNGTLVTGSKSLLNTTTAKIKNIIGTNLTLSEDDNNLTISAPYDKTTLDGKFDNKQNLLSNGTLITGSQSLLNTTTSKLKNIVGTNLTVATDDNNITITGPYDKTTLDGKFDNKQNKFLLADTLPADTSRLFDATGTKFRGIHVTSPLTIVTTNDDYLTINSDTYNKQTVDNKISALVNSAPDLLNTLGEISAYLGNPTNTSTTLLTTITNKANTSDTFLKSVINNDVYLKIDNNKRIVGTLTDNKFKFQILDNQGTTFTDAWIDVGTIEFNTLTKKAKFTVKDSLFIDTTDVLTTLNAKLANTDPRITQSAFSWSSTSFGPDGVTLNGAYNYLNTGTELLVINVDATTTSAAFFGPNAGTQKGNVLFYKSVEVSGALKGGSVNIIDELATKLTTTSTLFTNSAVAWSSGFSANSNHILYTGTEALQIRTPTALELAMTIQGSAGGITNEGKTTFYKQVTIPQLELQGDLNIVKSATNGLNVVTSVTNTGLNGFSSLYLKTTGQATDETGQLFVGQQQGLVMMTRTAHALRFKTYSDEVNATVPFSMQILGTGTRDVEILAPLIIKCQQTTIDNGIIIGGSQSDSANGLYVSNNAIINKN